MTSFSPEFVDLNQPCIRLCGRSSNGLPKELHLGQLVLAPDGFMMVCLPTSLADSLKLRRWTCGDLCFRGPDSAEHFRVESRATGGDAYCLVSAVAYNFALRECQKPAQPAQSTQPAQPAQPAQPQVLSGVDPLERLMPLCAQMSEVISVRDRVKATGISSLTDEQTNAWSEVLRIKVAASTKADKERERCQVLCQNQHELD